MAKDELGPPWSTQPSLKIKCQEIGIDFKKFIHGLSQNRSDQDLAHEFNVPEKTIVNLREQFMRYGVDSVMGQD
ncbi:MAG: helix-turn-helix domain-containing protein [Bacillota bacterium]